MIKNIALGGVFDRFHEGHQASILKAIGMAERVYLLMFAKGDEESHPNKMADSVMPFGERKSRLSHFLIEHDKENKVVVTLMPDDFGVKAIFKWSVLWTVKDLTLFQCEDDKEIAGRLFGLIDEKRKEIGLPVVKVIWTESIKDKYGNKLSASNLRKEEVKND